MEVLVIGVSSIVTRRVLPALAALDDVEKIHLASRRTLSAPDSIPAEKRGRVIQGYGRALTEIIPCLVYLSLPNSLHAEWASKALDAGFHVIVDKPAFISLRETEALLQLAKSKKLLLGEATVWNFHPQVEAINKFLCEEGVRVTRLSATFSFPPLQPSNFRCCPELGGGSLLDLGPYAASCSRVFLGEPPHEVVCRVHTRAETSAVDTSFSMLASYQSGKSMVGQFGFNTEYHNSVSLLGPGLFIELDRAFTIPGDYTNHITIRHDSHVSTLTIPPADSFRIFLRLVLDSIAKASWPSISESILQDAQFRYHMTTCSS